MIYVTNGYDTKEFESEIQAHKHIAQDISKHGLSSMLVFDHAENNIRVLVYQYSTLYLETYILHYQMNLIKED